MSVSVQMMAVGLSRAAAMLGLLATMATTATAQTSAADASNAIERVDATQTSTGVVVSIELKSAPPGIPASFSVANPARVALDIPATVNALGKNLVAELPDKTKELHDRLVAWRTEVCRLEMSISIEPCAVPTLVSLIYHIPSSGSGIPRARFPSAP